MCAEVTASAAAASAVAAEGAQVTTTYLHVLRGLLQGDLDTLDPVGLPAAHAQQPLLLGNRDGIALHVLHAPPGESKVCKLLLCWLGL